MAGITKRPNSKYWWAIYYDGAGNKVRRSTKLEKRKEALDVAMEWEKLARAGQEGRIVEEQCRRVVSEIAQRYGGQPLTFYTTRQWFTEWLAGKSGVAERTLKRWQLVVREFLEHLGARADLTIRAVTVSDVRQFRDDQAKRATRSNETVNQTIRHVLAMPFGAARKQGYIDTNPCHGVPMLPVEKARRETFTPEQVGKLVAAASEEWRGVILGGYYTALRLRDVTDLDAKNIVGKSIRLKTRKTGHEVEIPIHPVFGKWLKKHAPKTGPVFPSLAGRKNPTTLSKAFKEIMAKAGIAGRRIREGRGRNTTSLSFHCLRHSMNSALANAGVAREVRKALTGHMDDRSHDTYTHHSSEVMARAVNKLPVVEWPKNGQA